MARSKILELFGSSTSSKRARWGEIVKKQWCPFVDTRCFKVRKSNPKISIGTCVVQQGVDSKDVIICPNRLLERKQVILDCVHLLTLHEPGNELHVVPEVSIPGGSVDYFLISARGGKVLDFVAIELQTLDTTGTVWPERQRTLATLGVAVSRRDVASEKSFGMNWKMTAKTTLVQLHHKIQTFEHIGKHLVLVIQNHLLSYMRTEFSFSHLSTPRLGDAMHFHAYKLSGDKRRLELETRVSTDAAGIAKCLGLQAEAKVELEVIVAELEKKISANTLLGIAPPLAPMEQMPTE